MGPGQRGLDRPFPGGRPYRATEPDQLYLCGASTHPGGNITGNPGYIAAAEILTDLGIRHWWTPRDVWKALANGGGLTAITDPRPEARRPSAALIAYGDARPHPGGWTVLVQPGESADDR
ncbi:hypothetical protein ACFQH9_25090 [Pseudonocardia lutea]|uniref:Uncharacterized protein n=1 Tax=Pseudonocardia lutea TaxID=2172015 RepID=A0ABW1IE30_9PSEU